MNSPMPCWLCALGMAIGLVAPTAAQTPPPATTIYPPPALGAPGARAVAPASTPSSASSAPLSGTAAPPALPGGRGQVSRDRRGEPPPTVKVHKQKGNLVEEYYDGGQLYMVRVRPRHGVPYTYFVSKGHKLRRGPGAPPVSPTLYKVLEWGKPSAPANDGDSD